jgi:maltooligosyltrehalose trehalohydrolase
MMLGLDEPQQSPSSRRLPIGAEISSPGVHFRLWAPSARRVAVAIGDSGTEHELDADGEGYFTAFVRDARAGDLYRYKLDDTGEPLADPVSRFQPDGPHGPSMIVDPAAFGWSDSDWRGISLDDQVIYEMHVGAFTKEGTWAAAADALPTLAELGITAIEVMPVADFPGRFGWGYDGVNLFAPTRLYGTPDDMRRFVDRAHALGIGVLLDVVYNHVGPDGNHLGKFGPYFSDRYKSEWGPSFNFDGKESGPVREFALTNAQYWIEEFHVDGLRLDATQQIFDASREHIIAAIAAHAREAARRRGRAGILIVGENEPQHTRLLRPRERGGLGLDALWNDDFHHSARVAVGGRREAYYTDYAGSPQELVSTAKWGFLFQGQRYAWQKQRRGTPAFGLPSAAFVNFLDNHDQVANSGRGDRLHMITSPGRLRAITALLLLGPGTPMLFMGQEHAAPSPFLYFADHQPPLASAVRDGRADFLSQFRSISAGMREHLADPADPATFERCRLDSRLRHSGNATLRLHRDLLRLRRTVAAFRAQHRSGVDGAVVGPEALVLRFFAADGDRLLFVNLGGDLRLASVAEPLLATPEHHHWVTEWSSDDPQYGGGGTPRVEDESAWCIPGHAAVVLRPVPEQPPASAA